MFVSPTEAIFSEFRKFFVEGHPDECWPWLGKTRGKYGKFYWKKIRGKGRSIHAHRAHIMLRKGVLLPSNIHVCHSCDNPICVNPNHLFECSHLENMLDRDLKGRQAKGNQLPQTKLTSEQVLEILKSTEIAKVVAQKYNISSGRVSRIRKRSTWKHLEFSGEITRIKAGGNRFEINPMARLTEENVREIRKSTLSNRKLSEIYFVKSEQIRRIKKRERWAHVSD